jgi:hypothetical protein
MVRQNQVGFNLHNDLSSGTTTSTPDTSGPMAAGPEQVIAVCKRATMGTAG